MEDYEGADVDPPEVPGYDVGRCLGRGGNACVWLVREQSTGHEFALKSFIAGGADRGSTEETVRRELGILSALHHEHLVRALAVLRLPGGRPHGSDGGGTEEGEAGGIEVREGDAGGIEVREGDAGGIDVRDGDAGGGTGSADGDLGLVMDYAAGGSLGQLLASRGKLGPGETVTVLTPIAQALAYLHSQGITHGDVSPGNVLFTAHGKPLLADLGVARMVADAQGVAEAGTDGFRDPAPVDAVRAGLQPARDVYSLAALGWFCLTGRAPEPGAQRPPLPLLVPGVPPELTAALEGGLHDDRRLRPTAAELADAVHRSATAVPVDLSVSVHSSVVPQLLTRKALPGTARGRRADQLRSLLRRFPRPRRDRSFSPAAASPAALGSQGFPSVVRAGGPGVPWGRNGARHTGGRAPSVPASPASTVRSEGTRPEMGVAIGYRAAAAALALSGALVTVWAFAGAPWPVLPSTFSEVNSEASRGPGSAQVAPAPPAPSTPTAAIASELQATLASPDPEQAVRGLARLRSQALSSGDFGLLDQVNAPASPAAEADGRISASLTASGRVLSGFSTELFHVAATPDTGSRSAVVDVRAGTSAYRELGANGTVLAEVAAAPEQRLRLVLALVEGRWRIQDILPPDDGGGDPAGSGDPATSDG